MHFLCFHFVHVHVQAGFDAVLLDMKREYTVAQVSIINLIFLCLHFVHVQAGSDAVLIDMKREYTVAQVSIIYLIFLINIEFCSLILISN